MDRALAAWLLNAGLMGRAERRFFEGAVTPGQVVVDVGANQGIFTLLFSRLVGPGGCVFALEPEPGLFGALDRNCRINAASNVTRVPAAAGQTRSKGVLHCSRFNSGDNRLTDSLKGRSVAVEIVPLDEILPKEQVSLVKIDVQGYELSVVKGMPAIMSRNPAIKVFFEYWPAGLGYAGSVPGELLEFFLGRGFSLFDLSGAGLRKLSADDVTRSTKTGDWSWRTLLAARE
jgi:FkbM family methyltransferase